MFPHRPWLPAGKYESCPLSPYLSQGLNSDPTTPLCGDATWTHGDGDQQADFIPDRASETAKQWVSSMSYSLVFQ